MKFIKGCIFDLDGVIVDTAKYHFLAWKRLADELGILFTELDNERLKGVSRMASLEILLEIGNKIYEEDKKYVLAEKKNNWYREYILKMDQEEVLPGVKAFMESLKKEDIKIALGSASKNALTILENINMINYFDAIIDGNKVQNAKPDPEVFILGAKELGLYPNECVVFEDAVAGIKAAKLAGMKVIGVGDSVILGNANIVIPGFNEVTLDLLNFK